MIDLSFLTDEEQESILKVLQRDSELKRIDDERVRHLPGKVKDDTEVKAMSGQWFYDAKSKRHREKIHGADIIRASIRRKPLITAELNQRKDPSSQNSINKEVSTTPEQLGDIEEKDGESKSNQSPETFTAASHLLEKPQEETRKTGCSPSKQRKNPFNDSTVAEDKTKCEEREDGNADVSEAIGKDKSLPLVENQPRINLPNDHKGKGSEQLPLESRQIGKMPVPKARKHIHKTSDMSLQSKDAFPKAPKRIKQLNGQGRPPKSILKRSSSSSSTDSEVLRFNQNLEPPKKSGLPTSTILEDVAEKSPSPGEDPSQNSLERLKQVRFSSSVNRNECPPNASFHEIKESGGFPVLDSDYDKTNDNKVDDLGVPQSMPLFPVKPPRSYSPILTLNGNVKDGQISQEGETTPSSYSFGGSDLQPLVKSPIVEPVLPGKSSSQILPGPADKQIEPQTKTKLLSREPGVTTQSNAGRQLPLDEQEGSEFPDIGPADPKQGKPALVEGHRADKHAAESLKATDESISKVLDWFKRSSSTERDFAEETDIPKSIGLSETREDNGSNTDVLHLNSSIYEKEEPASKDDGPHEAMIHPGQLTYSKNRSPRDILPGEHANLNQSRERETAASTSQEQNIHLNKRTLFQTISQLEDKTCGSTEIDDSDNSLCRRSTAFEDKIHLGLKNADSFGIRMERKTNTGVYADGERDVKSFLEEEDVEHKSGQSLEEHKGKRSAWLHEDTSHDSRRGNLQILHRHDLKESSLVGDKKRVKDIRAFWESDKVASKPANTEDLSNESRSVINIAPDYKKEHIRMKPMGGSSGYVTGESDNEQSKYNVVTLRKVELSEEDSETNADNVKLSSGTRRPIQMDKSTESQVSDTSTEVSSTAQQRVEYTGLQHPDNFCPGNKEEGRPEVTALELGSVPSAVQPKPYFQIHSLKEKIDEESKTHMLNPSQFQSLRSFWDEGTKPQSKPDWPKSKAIPRSPNRNVGSCKKELQELREVGTETSLTILGDKRSGFLLQEEITKEPTTKIAHQSSSEESRVISKQSEEPMLFPPPTIVPMSLDYALTKKNDSEEENELPVKQYIEKTIVSSEMQHSYFNNGFQKLLVEASQESLMSYPPIIEKGILQEELVAKRPVPYSGQIHEPNFFPTDTNRQYVLSADEIMEKVNRTLVPPKTDSDAFNTNLEKLLKETSDGQALPSHHEPATPLSEKRNFFNRVMERSHHYPSDKKESKGESQMKGAVQKRDSFPNQPVEFKTSRGSLPSSLEELKSVPKTGPDRDERQIYLDVIPTKEEVLPVLSPEPMLPAIQDRATYPEEEVSEMVSKSHVPSRRLRGDVDAKIVSLLKELSDSPTSENLSTTPFDGLPEKIQQEPCKQMYGRKDAASLQMTNLLRGTIGETVEGSKVAKKDGSALLLQRGEPVEQRADHNERIQDPVSIGEPTVGVTETVVKTIKTTASFKTRLNEELIRGREIPKPAHASLQPDQFVSKIYAKDLKNPQEIIESIEKATIPSSSRHAEFKTNIQKLFKESAEILSSTQKDTDCSSGVQTERMSHQVIGLVGQQEIDCDQEINETVSKTIAPSKFKKTELNSGLQKLLEEASEMLSSQQGCLGLLKEKSVIKSVAPGKDVAAFKSSLEKLIWESSDVPFQLPEEDYNRVTTESTTELEEQTLPVKMPVSEESMKIPANMVFQNIIHLNLALPGTHSQEKGEDSLTLSTADKRENKIKREKETDISIVNTSVNKANEKLAIAHEFQQPSTPLVKSPSKASKVELWLIDAADDDKGGARSLGSDFSDENKSFLGIQSSPLRSEEELNPVMESLKRNSIRQTPSKSLEDIPAATSNKGKVIHAREDLMLSAEDVSTEPSFSDSQFSHPEKIKMMSKSVPAFLQDESDDRETDTASESSYPLCRIKKCPSSLTNLSDSSGLASLSSVSTSVMSIYSGDFGNVDVKGNIQFAIDYVEQLKELHIFIAQGKDLAVADVKKQRSDPYVKSYLLPEKYKLGKRKTSVKRKTLNPVYNEILRYKVDKAVLETQRLNISVWHNDTFGRNSFLGEVELDLGTWDWNERQSKQMIWYPLKPRTPLTDHEVENRGEIKIALQYIPQPAGGKKTPATGEVHIWVKECSDLPVLRGSKLNSFVKCTILPDTSRKSRQKTRAVGKTTNPVFNHTMVYDGFRPEDLKEACVELTVWDHNKLANHFLGGLRIGLGTGRSYGTPVDWMDSTIEEASLWERMISSPNTWVEDILPLRMLMVAKMTK